MTLSKSTPERRTPTARPALALLLPLCVLCCGASLFLSWSWLPAAVILLAVVTLVVGWLRIGRSWTALIVLILAMPGCKPTQRPIQDSIVGNDAAQIRELVSVEERILALTPQLRELSKSMQNLRLPDGPRLIHFASEVTVGEAGQAADFSAPGELDLLRPLLKEAAWIEQASFYFIDGRFPDEEEDLFEGEVGFRGLAKLKSGGWQGLIGKFLIRWTKATGEEDAEWKISGWEQKELATMASSRRLFGDVLGTALPRPVDRALAHRSPHQEAAIKFYQGGAKKHPHPYFAPISVNQKPGLAVVDIDKIHSVSQSDVSTIMIDFDEYLNEVEYEAAVNDVRAALDRARDLPADAEEPWLTEIKFSETAPAVMVVLVDTGEVGPVTLREVARDVKTRMRDLYGANRITVRGGQEREVLFHEQNFPLVSPKNASPCSSHRKKKSFCKQS